MPREITTVEINRRNTLCAKGWALTNSRLILDGSHPPHRPGWYERWQLRRSIRCFLQALEIDPNGWPAMWALGKIYQRFGNQSVAFDWFSKAHAVNPNQPDVAREAGIAALDIGRIPEALELCQTAVKKKPHDPGLVCNLALACCMAGLDADAVRYATEAAHQNPNDDISANVLKFVKGVASGTCTRPKRLEDAFPYG